MISSGNEFKNAIDKAYLTQPNVKLNSTTIGDAIKYKSGFTEEKDEYLSKDNQKEMVDGIIEIVRQVKDINNRKTIVKDMIKKFKKENIDVDYNKFMKDCGIEEMVKKETNEVDNDEYEYETFLEKSKKLKKSAKDQFAKDISQDKDYLDFKKNAEYKDENENTRSFGTPNAVHNDSFVRKNKYSRIGREESKIKEESLDGGLTDNKTLEDIAKKHDKKGYYHIDNMVSSLKKELEMGIKVEMEHTKDKKRAKAIAMDHLWETPNYYNKLKKVETKEATGSGSSGAYSGPVFGGNDEFWERSKSETPKLKESDIEKVEAKEATTSGSVGGYESPSMWAKSTSKKDWGPSRKTQIPGGGFVKVKKKCTKFPYCNQGDINNLKISKNESVKEAIENVAKKLGVSKDVIMTILEHEYENIGKRIK